MHKFYACKIHLNPIFLSNLTSFKNYWSLSIKVKSYQPLTLERKTQTQFSFLTKQRIPISHFSFFIEWKTWISYLNTPGNTQDSMYEAKWKKNLMVNRKSSPVFLCIIFQAMQSCVYFLFQHKQLLTSITLITFTEEAEYKIS